MGSIPDPKIISAGTIVVVASCKKLFVIKVLSFVAAVSYEFYLFCTICVKLIVYSDLSPTMDAEADNVFNREAVGRQSMSEKRKAYMDTRLLNFYQQAKTVRGRVFSAYLEQ